MVGDGFGLADGLLLDHSFEFKMHDFCKATKDHQEASEVETKHYDFFLPVQIDPLPHYNPKIVKPTKVVGSLQHTLWRCKELDKHRTHHALGGLEPGDMPL